MLVDDELSTGRTAMNTIAALQGLAPRARYVVAALVDVRSSDDRAVLAAFAVELGVRVDVVALGSGRVELPDGFASAVAGEVDRRHGSTPGRGSPGKRLADVRNVPSGWPVGVRESARHGFGAVDVARARTAAAEVAGRVRPELLGPRVLVLGSEELVYVPTLIGLALTDDPGLDVRVSSTTRSPVLVVDEAGYPIRSALAFDSHDRPADGPGPRFAYNVANAFDPAGPDPAGPDAAGPDAACPNTACPGTAPPEDNALPDDIVLVVDDDSDPEVLAGGVVAALRPWCRRVHVVTLPCHRPLPVPLHGPEFGSYAPDEVSWLLTDLSAVELEAPDRGTGRGDPVRRRPLRRIAAGGVPARRALPTTVRNKPWTNRRSASPTLSASSPR